MHSLPQTETETFLNENYQTNKAMYHRFSSPPAVLFRLFCSWVHKGRPGCQRSMVRGKSHTATQKSSWFAEVSTVNVWFSAHPKDVTTVFKLRSGHKKGYTGFILFGILGVCYSHCWGKLSYPLSIKGRYCQQSHNKFGHFIFTEGGWEERWRHVFTKYTSVDVLSICVQVSPRVQQHTLCINAVTTGRRCLLIWCRSCRSSVIGCVFSTHSLVPCK